MANTFELISSVTVGAGGAASIDFTSIPATYTDLCIELSSRTTGATNGDLGYLYFNGASTNQSVKRLQGDGSSVTSNSYSTIYFGSAGANDTASTFGNAYIYIPNYAGSSYKSVSIDSVNENNATTAYARLFAGLWSSTSAINQVTLYPNNGVWAQYSTAYLYGVKNA